LKKTPPSKSKPIVKFQWYLLKGVVEGGKLMTPPYMSQQLCKLIHEQMISTSLYFDNPKKGLESN
jgi:hypothetical protein